MHRERLIIAASVGNTLEWFDLAVFGFFAPAIGQAMFPHADARAALLMAYGAFAVTYLVRPLGALILGAAADRVGRKSLLLVSISLMMVGTAMLVLTPSYRSIGVWATVGVLVARCLQAFSAGGEFGAATALLIEQAPGHGGFMASWQSASQAVSFGLASAFGVLLTRTLTPDQLITFGWRVPFVFGLLIGPVGLYVRRHIEEGGLARSVAAHAPLLELSRWHKAQVLYCIGLLVPATSLTYLFVYVPTYASASLHLGNSAGFAAGLLVALLLTVFTPVTGWLSDHFGRPRLMRIGALLFLCGTYPLFHWLASGPSEGRLTATMVAIAAVKAMYSGPLPALMSEQFPAEVRATGLNIAYNIGVPLFGGFVPLILTWLTAATGDSTAPALYVMGGALIALGTLSVPGLRRGTSRAFA